MANEEPLSADIRLHFDRANSALRDGTPERAINEMQRLLQRELADGVRAEANLCLAAACRALGRTTEEQTALDAALAADAYFWPALLQKGVLLEGQGQRKAAAVIYRDVLRIAPDTDARPAAFRPALAHAEELVGLYGEALETTLLDAISDLPGMSARWQEAVTILSGRSRPYVSESNQLAVPRLPAQPFFRRDMFDWVAAFERHTASIREEMLNALADTEEAFVPYVQYQPGEPVNQWRDLNHSRDWTSYHLYRSGEPVQEHLARCPKTAEALALVDAVHLSGTCPNAMFSVLAPRTRIPPHHGESNARLVAHLPLVVPDGCLFRVGFDNRRWVEGEVLVFDDTIEHEAVNDSDRLRVVLIFDVWNPLLSLEERVIVQRLAAAERAFRLGS
ncbi:MAG: aspartyl/asparaginyl beta-hydroxylase domain-containing protein [Pseudomonadales bacterium]